jgi:hypothetical protein
MNGQMRQRSLDSWEIKLDIGATRTASGSSTPHFSRFEARSGNGARQAGRRHWQGRACGAVKAHG